MYDENTIIGFIGIIHFPHPNNKKIKSVTRLVILPDYQGIGLGTKFLNAISDIYVNQGYDFKIQTNAKNLMLSLMKNDKWILSRYGKVNTNSKMFEKTSSEQRNTATFFRKKENNAI